MVLSNEDDLYDYLLLFWYKTKLQEAYEKGFYKTYRRFDVNGEKLRGSIDVSRHIKLNIGQNNGKMAFTYRENTVNNYLNHLIVGAYEYLKKKFPELIEQNFDMDLDFKSILEEIKSVTGYSQIDNRTLIKENIRPISHPYYMEYEDLRLICLKILRDEGISIWDSAVENTKSILFYIPDLWELYLEDKLREESDLGKDLYAQGTMPNTSETIRIFGESNIQVNGDFERPIYPDYVFFDEETPYLALDAKFKKSWGRVIGVESSKNSNIWELKDFDKSIRDMNAIKANATGVIFPIKINEANIDKNKIIHKISMFNDTDIFYTFPIPVPLVEEQTYSTWKKQFDVQVKEAISIIKDYVLIEKKYANEVRATLAKISFPKRSKN